MTYVSELAVVAIGAVLLAGCSEADIRLPTGDGGGGRDTGRADSSVADASDPTDSRVPGMDAAVADAGDGSDAAVIDAFVPGTDAGPPLGPGDLVFTEIMVSSDVVPDDFGEWFEIYNTSTTTAFDLRGCLITDDGNVHVVTTSVPIPPGGRIAAARSADPGFAEDYVYADVKLSNTGDTLTLSCAGMIVDAVTYTATWPYSNGASLSLDPDFTDATDNDLVTSWCSGVDVYNAGAGEVDLGTPGDPNPECP